MCQFFFHFRYGLLILCNNSDQTCFALGFQHFPADLANVNEWKIIFDPSIQNLIKFIGSLDLRGNKIQTSIKGRNSVENLQKMILYNPNLDLIKHLIKFYPFILKILSGKEILTSIKACTFAANLRNLMPNLDIINDNVYTEFG